MLFTECVFYPNRGHTSSPSCSVLASSSILMNWCPKCVTCARSSSGLAIPKLIRYAGGDFYLKNPPSLRGSVSNNGIKSEILSSNGTQKSHFQMRVRKIAPKILQLLTEWTETFPYDFRDERMMRSLKELTHRLASGDEVSPFCLSSFPLTTTRSDFLD